MRSGPTATRRRTARTRNASTRRYVRLPGGAGPSEIGALVGNVDVAPTIAELTGIERSGFDGQSLVPLLTGELGPGPAAAPAPREVPRQAADLLGDQDRRWKYVIQTDGERELYDLRADPSGSTVSRVAALSGARGDVARADPRPAQRLNRALGGRRARLLSGGR